MTNRVRLTAGRVREFQCPSGKWQSFLWDSDAPGMAVRATGGGAKAYIFQGRWNEKTIRVTIGDVGAWSIEQARQEARRLQTLVDSGRDPRQVKAEIIAADNEKRASENALVIPAMVAWNNYLEDRRSKWSERSFLEHVRLSVQGGQLKRRGRKSGESDRTMEGPMFGLLQNPLQQIDKRLVSDWLQSNEHRPAVARNGFVRLRAFLNWCSDQSEYADQVHLDACNSRLMRDQLPRPQVKDDCLQREQLRPWFDAVRKIPNRTQSAYLQILLITGARRNEISALKWTDVDLDWNSVTIKDKVEGERVIPLTPYVKWLIKSLKPDVISLNTRVPVDPSPYVFVSPTSLSGHITEPRIAHNRALQAGGLPPLTIHGLRRSFATLAEWVECPAGVTAQIMGHKPSAIAEKHYRRRPLDLLRQWHTKIETWILREAGVSIPVASEHVGTESVSLAS